MRSFPNTSCSAAAAWLEEHTWLTTKSYRGLDHAVSLDEFFGYPGNGLYCTTSRPACCDPREPIGRNHPRSDAAVGVHTHDEHVAAQGLRLGACDVARLEHVLDDAQLDAVAFALDLFRLSDRLRAAAHVRP